MDIFTSRLNGIKSRIEYLAKGYRLLNRKNIYFEIIRIFMGIVFSMLTENS